MEASRTVVQAVRGWVGAAGSTTIRDPDGRRLVADCLAQDAAARTRFQKEFGPLIYRFAEYAGRGATEPGDFYVYLFDNDRLFQRLRSYEGRSSLGPFLRGYALPDLFRQFQVMNERKQVDTVSLDDCPRELGAASQIGDEPEVKVPPAVDGDGRSSCTELFEQLSPEKRVLVKLLYIEDFDLDGADMQLLAARSGRPVREVIELAERARESVRTREVMRRRREDEAESAAHWILSYDRRLAQAADDLKNLPPKSTRAERLREQQAELERKRAWRQQQRERALAESRRAVVTLRYREIAHILNVPVGNVSAQVTRLRQELLHLAAQHASGRSSSASAPPCSPSPSGKGLG